MPYSIQLFGKNKGVVYNTKTGHKFSQHPIKLSDAKKQEHLLQAIHYGFIPLGQKPSLHHI